MPQLSFSQLQVAKVSSEPIELACSVKILTWERALRHSREQELLAREQTCSHKVRYVSVRRQLSDVKNLSPHGTQQDWADPS